MKIDCIKFTSLSCSHYRVVIITIISFLFFQTNFSCGQSPADKTETENCIQTIRINENCVMATIGPEAITAIATQKGIIIVDAGTSYTLTRKYREAIEKELNRDDFVYVINTHAHWDHISGNAVFSEAKIIGHENCPVEKAGNKRDPEKMRSWVLKIMDEYQMAIDTLEKGSPDWQDAYCQKARFGAVYDDLSQLPAERDWDITFKDEFSLDMGNVNVDMKFFGKAHSHSDIIIHIPQLKLLFTGDLFSKWGRASIYDDIENDAEQWKIAMEWVMTRKNEIETIIGGHGQLMNMDDLVAFERFVDSSGSEN